MKGKTILVIGGTGSWGQALVARLLREGAAKVRVLARNEHNMIGLRDRIADDRLELMLGDIQNAARVMQACQDCDVVFHLAALKHVPICEQMPEEAIATNVTGTEHLIAAARYWNVEQVFYISTDKAVQPQNTYGATKMLSERLMLAADREEGSTRFSVFRCGNLFGSSGSVVPVFARQIASQGRVCLTDRRMTRFFITIPDAVESLLAAARLAQGGEIFVPALRSLSIYDLAVWMLARHGLSADAMEETGIRPGEGLFETMLTPAEQQALYRVADGLYAVLLAGDGRGLPAGEGYVPCSRDAVLPAEEARRWLDTVVEA